MRLIFGLLFATLASACSFTATRTMTTGGSLLLFQNGILARPSVGYQISGTTVTVSQSNGNTYSLVYPTNNGIYREDFSCAEILTPTVSGGIITISVRSPSGGTHPAGIQWSLALPAGTTLTGANTGSAAQNAGKTVSCTPDYVTCIVSGPNTTAIPDGVVASLPYALPSAAGKVSIVNPMAAAPNGDAVGILGYSANLPLALKKTAGEPRRH